jgi:glycosyltransferase involved in cell wall biosynthesis
MCAFNEIARLPRAWEDVLASLADRPEMVEIIILDNGSTDGTRDWLRQLDHPLVRIEFNEKNLGKGGSVKKGLRLSRGKYVVIHDPDLEYQAADLWRLLDAARESGAALVLGSRVLGRGVQFKYLTNYIGVLGLSRMIRVLYGCRLTDSATGMKLMEGTLGRRLKLECGGFELDLEIITRIARLGGTVGEIAIDYRPRSKAEGKKVRAVRDGLRALRPILGDWLRPLAAFTQPAPDGQAESGARDSAQPAMANDLVSDRPDNNPDTAQL